MGFDWSEPSGLIDKLREETAELEAELQNSPVDHGKAENELGDLLFTTVNLARHLKIEPEFALRAANAKFRERFNVMEAAAGGPEALKQRTAEELEQLWRTAKDSIANNSPAL